MNRIFGKKKPKQQQEPILSEDQDQAFVGLDDDMIVYRVNQQKESISDEDEVLNNFDMKDDSFTKLDQSSSKSSWSATSMKRKRETELITNPENRKHMFVDVVEDDPLNDQFFRVPDNGRRQPRLRQLLIPDDMSDVSYNNSDQEGKIQLMTPSSQFINFTPKGKSIGQRLYLALEKQQTSGFINSVDGSDSLLIQDLSKQDWMKVTYFGCIRMSRSRFLTIVMLSEFLYLVLTIFQIIYLYDDKQIQDIHFKNLEANDKASSEDR